MQCFFLRPVGRKFRFGFLDRAEFFARFLRISEKLCSRFQYIIRAGRTFYSLPISLSYMGYMTGRHLFADLKTTIGSIDMIWNALDTPEHEEGATYKNFLYITSKKFFKWFWSLTSSQNLLFSGICVSQVAAYSSTKIKKSPNRNWVGAVWSEVGAVSVIFRISRGQFLPPPPLNLGIAIMVRDFFFV